MHKYICASVGQYSVLITQSYFVTLRLAQPIIRIKEGGMFV